MYKQEEHPDFWCPSCVVIAVCYFNVRARSLFLFFCWVGYSCVVYSL